MAHDFYISLKKVKNDETDIAYFFGFASGIMYEAFQKHEHNAIFSGDCKKLVITREEAIKGLATAINLFDKLDYPDPTRMDDIKDFYSKIFNEFKTQNEFIICYC